MSATILELAQAVGEATRDARETVHRLTCECERLAIENERLRRELGKARLLADLRRQRAELVNDPTPALLRRQAE